MSMQQQDEKPALGEEPAAAEKSAPCEKPAVGEMVADTARTMLGLLRRNVRLVLVCLAATVVLWILEELGEELCSKILSKFGASYVAMRLTKPQAVRGATGGVGIEIARGRVPEGQGLLARMRL
ncbi:MAG: dihydroneopterin aldolase [Succinivibrio sp.]